MRRRHLLSLLIPLTVLACNDTTAPLEPEVVEQTALPVEPVPALATPSVDEARTFAASSNAFGFDLMRTTKPGENVAISPFSISTALTMAYAGAVGDTETQMRDVMHMEGEKQASLDAAGKLAASLRRSEGAFKVAVANRLFGERTYAFEDSYLATAKDTFGASLAPVDFKLQPEASRQLINDWVKAQTADRIPTLIPEGQVTPLTRLVLVNAMSFDAKWAAPFDGESTIDGQFTISKQEMVSVPTMHAMRPFKLASAEGMKMLEIPYEGGSMSMLIALPDETYGLADMEASMSAERLAQLRASATMQQVDVSLPRFNVDPAGPMALSDALIELGMTAAFDAEKADFSRIANPSDPADRLSLAQVFHKTVVRVNEKGTEAAAATAVGAKCGGAAPSAPASFRADHPFSFFVVDNDSGAVLFMGRVVDPKGA